MPDPVKPNFQAPKTIREKKNLSDLIQKLFPPKPPKPQLRRGGEEK